MEIVAIVFVFDGNLAQGIVCEGDSHKNRKNSTNYPPRVCKGMLHIPPVAVRVLSADFVYFQAELREQRLVEFENPCRKSVCN